MLNKIHFILKKNKKRGLRFKRKIGIRQTIFGTNTRPRVTVFKSSKHIYVQAIDDEIGETLTYSNTLEKSLDKNKLEKKDLAKKIGKILAERLQKKGISQVVFDRNGFLYTGRIAAVAEGLREVGLKV